MSKVYAITSQKGGVGKTTTAINFGAELARRGYKVLLIDADAQGSLTAGLGYREPDRMEITLASVMEKVVNDEKFNKKEYGIVHHGKNLDILPCNIELSGLEVSLANAWCREVVLSKYINRIRDYYDYTIIDCMPSLSLITINVLAAADRVIIPVQAAYLSIKGLEQLLKTIGKVKRGLNSDLGVEGILITMLDNRTNYAKDIVSSLENTYGRRINLFESKIPFSIRASEAATLGISIFEHDPKGKVAKAYSDFAQEVIDYE